jgi:hypothetical protein
MMSQNEKNMQSFMEQVKVFREKASAHISGSALPDLESLADLAHSLNASSAYPLPLTFPRHVLSASWLGCLPRLRDIKTY